MIIIIKFCVIIVLILSATFLPLIYQSIKNEYRKPKIWKDIFDESKDTYIVMADDKPFRFFETEISGEGSAMPVKVSVKETLCLYTSPDKYKKCGKSFQEITDAELHLEKITGNNRVYISNIVVEYKIDSIMVNAINLNNNNLTFSDLTPNKISKIID